jgi:hypothetical protein
LNNCGPFLEFPCRERILVAAAIPILATAIVPASSRSLGLHRELEGHRPDGCDHATVLGSCDHRHTNLAGSNAPADAAAHSSAPRGRYHHTCATQAGP